MYNPNIQLKVSKFRNFFLVSTILPKNEWKQLDLRYNSGKVEFLPSFFGRIDRTKKRYFEINWVLGLRNLTNATFSQNQKLH